VLATTGTVGLGIGLAKGKKIVEKVKQAARYIGDTKERRAARKQQNAENEAELTRRKAEQEAKNPTTKPAKIKASRHTMKNIKRLKKQD
jgi:hypothetical protein